MGKLATIGLLVLGLAAPLGAAGAPRRAAGTLDLDATVRTTRTSSPAYCPPGTPATVSTCARYVGVGEIRGLGRVTVRYTKIIASRQGVSDCEVSFDTVVFDIAGKGTIELSSAACWRFVLPTIIGPFEFTTIGGSGSYAGVSGHLTFTSSVFDIPAGSADTWAGTVSVPGFEFDLTPPVLKGAVARRVAVARRAKRARVRYSVTAQDGVDGVVAASCSPRSGTLFKIGRTKVTCTAIDSSANESRATFAVTVKRKRGR